MKPFARHFRVVRYDRRGHGKSGVTKGPYSMAMLGQDALAIMDALDLKKVNWCGLSMGGMVGQWLGANAPDRIERLVLANTHYYYPAKEFWNDRIKTVSEKGLAHIVGPNMERWFTKDFREREPETDRTHDARCSSPRRSRAMSPAAPPCATWITATCCRRSARRRW